MIKDDVTRGISVQEMEAEGMVLAKV